VVRKRTATERQIAELLAELEAEESEAAKMAEQEAARESVLGSNREARTTRRGGRNERQ
jgi:hypothetical protein